MDITTKVDLIDPERDRLRTMSGWADDSHLSPSWARLHGRS